jgi:CRP-like cAMP-binding protein
MRNPAAMSVLRTNTFFRGVSETVLEEIAGLCRNREYGRGDIVFEEGSVGTKLFGVIRGELIITTMSPQGQELHLNVVRQGEIVGEIAFLDGGCRTASGRATDQTTCFEIDRAAFYHLLERTPLLSTHLLQLVCQRVRWMTKLVADSAFLSVPERLATRLHYLSVSGRNEGEPSEVRISQSDLAQFLGISRQVVNSYLKDWERAGRLELARGVIRIKDPKALFALAGE